MAWWVESTVTSPAMTQINYWSNVIPFAGRVVAYKTNSCYLSASKGFVVKDPSIQFGCVDESPDSWSSGIGYGMIRLLKPEESTSSCALVNTNVTASNESSFIPSISMRLATQDEISLISHAILAGQAKLEDVSREEAIKLLD